MSHKWLIKLIAFEIPTKMFPLTEKPPEEMLDIREVKTPFRHYHKHGSIPP